MVVWFLALALQGSTALEEAREAVRDLSDGDIAERSARVDRLGELAEGDPAVRAWLAAEARRHPDPETRARVEQSLCRATHLKARGMGWRKVADLGRHDGDVSQVAYTPDGRFLLAAGGARGDVRAWDTGTWKVIADDTGPVSEVVSLSAGGGSLAAFVRIFPGTEGKGRLTVLDVASGAALLQRPLDSPATAVLRPDGRKIVLVGEGTATLLDIPSGATREQTEAVHACYSSDSKWLALASTEGIRVLATDSGQEAWKVDFCGDRIEAMYFRPGTTDLLLTEEEGGVWLAACGQPLRHLDSLDRRIGRCLGVDPSGRWAAFRKEGLITVASLDPGGRLQSWVPDGKQVSDAAFDPRGGALATCSEASTVKIWQVVEEGAAAGTRLKCDFVACVTAAGEAVWWTAEGLYRGWPGSSQPPASLGRVGQPRAAAASADGSVLLLQYEGGRPRVIDGFDGRDLIDSSAFGPDLESGAVSRGGDSVALVAEDGRIETWSVSLGARTHTSRLEGGELNFSPRLDRAIGESGLWDTSSGKRLVLEYEADSAKAFSPDGRRLAVGGPGIHVVDLATGLPCATLVRRNRPQPRLGRWCQALAFDPTGGRLLVLSSQGWDAVTLVEVWDLSERRCAAWFGVVGSFRCGRFLSDGRVALWGEDEILFMRPGNPPALGRTLEAGRGRVRSLSVDEGRGLGVTLGWDGVAKVWDLRTRRLVRVFGDESMPLEGAFLLPGTGQIILSGQVDTTEVRDLRDGSLVVLLDVKGGYSAFDVSPEGARVAGAGDGRATIWRTADWTAGFSGRTVDTNATAVAFAGAGLLVAESPGG
jgi:WD40 repeat protein